MCCTVPGFLLFLLSLIFPPLPVWITRGLFTADSLINIALTVLGLLPGLLHSWYIIVNTPSSEEAEHQNVYAPRGYRAVPSDLESGHNQEATPTTPLHPSGPFSNSGNRNVGADYFNDHNAPGNETVNYYYVNAPSRETSPRQQNRNYGTLSGSGAPDQAQETPPTYNEATRGDHKVQQP